MSLFLLLFEETQTFHPLGIQPKKPRVLEEMGGCGKTLAEFPPYFSSQRHLALLAGQILSGGEG